LSKIEKRTTTTYPAILTLHALLSIDSNSPVIFFECDDDHCLF